MSILKNRNPKAILREIWVTGLLIVGIFAFRWTVAEPYVVPTGSMEPTILPGDRLVVFKAYYSLKFPFTQWELLKFNQPKRGDIIVFKYPVDPSIDFVKRVVGLPGDELEIVDGVIRLNGQLLPLKDATTTPKDTQPAYSGFPLHWNVENLTSVDHWVQRIEGMSQRGVTRITVPPGHYFFVGDNRDNSNDSRSWGLVPEANLKGKALVIWLSFTPNDSILPGPVRWDRIGDSLYREVK